MYQFDRIKLVIWDLDDTLWKGTISEEDVVIPAMHRQLLQRLTDIGVVNSICSKNDWEPVQIELEKEGLLSYFVFPSVNWEAKGNRIKQLINDMQLRPANVLFLDDNPSNREEARFFCPDIMTDGPESIAQLYREALKSEKRDSEHKRLKQYRILEEKRREKAQYASNEAFLMESDIRVEVRHDCLKQIDRIHELILRSNQLNFTKLRSTKGELDRLLRETDVDSGYCIVSDRFGEYGIVGFYARQAGKLIHFTFSCRTLGMGIEQYMYNWLQRPELQIVGEVISDLSSEEIPAWINQSAKKNAETKMKIDGLKAHTVLVKGPCDLFQIYPYIAQTELFDTEFTYTLNNGLTIESTGHTTHIVEAMRLTEAQKKRVLQEVPFADAGMYSDAIFRNPYKAVFISILADANLGVYQRKGTGERLAFLEYIHPITDPKNWPGLLTGAYPCAGFHFSEEVLRAFAQTYDFVGRNTPEQILDNLKYIRQHLAPDCTLVIMLGGELYYEKNTYEAYMDRHVVHKQINDLLRAWSAGTEGVRLMDVNRYLVDQSSFYDHFNHYIKPVYYQLAREMVDIVNECTGGRIQEKSKLKMVQIRIKEMLAPVYYKLRKLLRR